LLSAEDSAQLCKWNSTVSPRVERCIHDLVLHKMATQPAALAISAWDGEMTYGELDDASRRLAYHLIERGVGPEIMVGMCMDKSKLGVVAMLAILRAGGAVVPLGIQHPVARIEGIVKDTAAPLVLVDRSHEQRLATLAARVPLLAIDSFFDAAPVEWAGMPDPAAKPCTSVRPAHAAWVIYTSGSTGKPKGVVLEHDALATSILAHGPVFGINSRDRLSQFAAYTFDVAIGEVMTTLSFGACICVPSENDRINRLTSFLAEAKVTIAALTSTVAKLVQPQDTPTVRTMILIGEAVQPKVIDQWVQQATIINAYGPSECSIWMTGNKIRNRSEASNIGKPLSGGFWVVNPANIGQLVPLSAPGELLIEAPLLARGYLNDSAKTAAAFVTDPAFVQQLGLSAGRRMYRTGDIVQQNADGSLTYLGRRDTQVKIRGQRVEMGEIESQIVRLLPAAREAVVDVVRPATEAHDGPLILVAVIEYPGAGPLLDSGSGLQPYEPSQITDAARKALEMLDTELGQVLPAYMVPAAFLLISRFPINASGKLDRRAVRDQLQLMPRDALSSFSSSLESKQAPTTIMEQKLQSLWATALALAPEAVGINDSFFRLGGDSVAAMKLTAAAHSQQIPLTVADIFRLPRLVDIAAAMEEKNRENNGLEDKDPAPLSLWPELAQIDAQTDDAERARLLADVAAQCSASTDQIEDVYPCSPLQAGLMAITAQRPEAYVVQRVFRLQADLSTQQLKAAWTRLAEILPILRTRIIPSVQADALQVVVREQPVWHDGTSLEKYLATDRATPITYGGALSRTAIIETGARRCFVWTTHHSVYDGWSLAEMSQLLGRLLRGETPSASVPVSRFIAYLARQDKEQTAAFWQRHLEGANWARYPALPSSLHHVNPRDALQQQLHIPQTAGAVTTPSLLRAAWALLVAVNTGAEEAVISVVLSGRMAAVKGITDLVAPTVATVPFHVSSLREQSVRDFLADIHDRATEMIPYEHTGLQNVRRMVPSLGSEFDPGHIFVVQAVGESGPTTPSLNMHLECEATSVDNFGAYPLTVECTVGSKTSDVKVELRFDQAVVAVPDAQRLLDQFGHIVQQLARNAETEQPLGRLSLLSAEDGAQLCKWNSTVPPRIERRIHDLVLDKMATQPTAPAISAWDGEMTYGELDAASHRLAHHLAGRGVGPEVMVGLCMDKSKWAVVAMLAILRAGGAVVPLGVQHPVARIEGIVKDTAMDVLLVDSSQKARLGSVMPATATIIVDATLHESLSATAEGMCDTVTADNVAWVLYTSGSTGEPKGVVLEHGALATSVVAIARFRSISAHTRTLQFAAFTFDVSITDIFCTMTRGGCVCLMSEEERMNDLAGCFQRANANYAHLTPTTVKLLSPDQIPTLKDLSVGGEAMESQIIDMWSGRARIMNSYGPSECAVTCATANMKYSKDAQNVGKPLAGAFWVVCPGSHHRLCPIGVAGELLIEGPQLARGYLNDPVKTAAAFVMDPGFVRELGLSPGRRMYRTGDIVQQNADGSLTYLGRRDKQVKIRGQRVEIGEIESQIVRLLPDVREVAVDVVPPASEAHDGPLILVAVIEYPGAGPLLDGGSGLEPYEPSQITDAARKALEMLDTELGQVLPAYMVPTAFLLVPRIPVNASGKLDRRAVRDQLRLIPRDALSSFAGSPANKQSPTTAMEQKLHSLWVTALALAPEAVGINDSFFRLGGDSVAAMKLTAAARAQGIPLSVADIFRWPRLADIAAAIEEIHRENNGLADEDPTPLSLWLELAQTDLQTNDAEPARQLADVAAQCCVSADQIEDVYPCSPLQAGLMAITAQRPEAYVVQRVFRLQAGLSTQQLKAAWTQLAEILPILRTRIIPSVQVDALQVVVREQPIWHEGTSLEEYLATDRATPIMYGGALSRTAIVENGARRYFVWTTHHSVYDGWSIVKMMEILAQLLRDERPSAPVPVSRFIAYLARQDKDETAAFWQRHLQGANWTRYPALPSPQQHINPRDILHHQLQVPLTTGSTTISTVLRAAWALLVATNIGADEAIINIVLSGRMAPVDGITDLVAPTVTTVPFRAYTSRNQTVRSFLADVYDRATDMIPYEHTGLQNIRRMVPGLGPEFDPGHIF
ncbi:acetyl-CoA synthetase-like protein, partial [Lojkania enalia]